VCLVGVSDMVVDLHLDDEDDMTREGRESGMVGWGEMKVESTLIDV